MISRFSRFITDFAGAFTGSIMFNACNTPEKPVGDVFETALLLAAVISFTYAMTSSEKEEKDE